MRAVSLAAVNSFLAEARTLALSQPERLSACMGNEACDLDSATSAIVRAFALSRLGPPLGSSEQRLVVPVMNVAQKDFPLRTEIVHHFATVGLDSSQLVFIDTLSLDRYAHNGALRLHLVDHNRLARQQEHLEASVVDIVDHHKDESRCPNSAASRRIVFPVGSCCTLVADHLLNELHATLDEPLARLLAGVILLDTGNLDPALGKTEPLDRTVWASLSRVAGLQSDAERERFSEQLRAAKFDVSKLSTYDLLRKDYKEFAMGGLRVGMSAVMAPLAELERRGGLTDDLVRWCSESALDLLVLMTAFYDEGGAFRREDVLCAPQGRGAVLDALAAHLLQQPSLALQASDGVVSNVPTAWRVASFVQRDVSASRKQLQPMLEAFFINHSLL